MDAVKSFKGYGKVDPAEDHEFRRRTRRRLIMIGVSSVLLLLIVVGAAVGVVLSRKGKADGSNDSGSSNTKVAQSIKAVCDVTRYPDACFASMSAAAANATDGGSFSPADLVRLSLRVASDGIARVGPLPSQLLATVPADADPRLRAALEICSELLAGSLDRMNDSMALIAAASADNSSSSSTMPSRSDIEDLRTWLSATLADQDTCLDAFENATDSAGFKDRLQAALGNSTIFSSNSLAIATGFENLLAKLGFGGDAAPSPTASFSAPPPQNRKLLTTTSDSASSTPSWVTSDPLRRRLLQAPPSWTGPVQATVAQDGTGDFTTITAALKTVPKKNTRPFIIRVKAGKYVESVTVEKAMWNVFMIGDGTDKTIISGSKNFVDGTPTFKTATFIVEGRGFMAQGMAFENTAGPQKHQAVAVRVKADHVVFYKCLFTAFQDTLYVHSLRQFYRECDIRGTVDFIFGDASVVFQRCVISPLQPQPSQKNTITAQGRTDPNEPTGIAIDDCIITPFGTAVTAKTYLGRPWKPYSTTVFMKSKIDGIVDPSGWLPWVADTNPPSTIFYGEYQNTGPGSVTSGRVKWAGYRSALSDSEAQRFSIGPFLQATNWLSNTGVPAT